MRRRGILRPKKEMCLYPISWLYKMANTLVTAVHLIPPPVPDGAPPILISIAKISKEHDDMELMLTVLNPEVVIAAVH